MGLEENVCVFVCLYKLNGIAKDRYETRPSWGVVRFDSVDTISSSVPTDPIRTSFYRSAI